MRGLLAITIAAVTAALTLSVSSVHALNEKTCDVCIGPGSECSAYTLTAPTEIVKNYTTSTSSEVEWQHTIAASDPVKIDFEWHKVEGAHPYSKITLRNGDKDNTYRAVINLRSKLHRKQTAHLLVHPGETCAFWPKRKIRRVTKLQLFGSTEKHDDEDDN